MRSPQLLLSLVLAGASFVALSGCDRGGPPAGAKPASATATPPGQGEAEPETGGAVQRPTITPSRDQSIPEALEPFAVMIQRRQTGPARVRLRRHLDEHPDDARAEFLFGFSYHREKKYARATEHFDRARRFEPGFALGHYFGGWAHYYLGQMDEARAAFETHLLFGDDEPDTHFGIGLIEVEAGNLEAAEQRFRTAIGLQQGVEGSDPRELSKAWARLADVQILRGDFTAARDALDQSIALFPDQYEALFKLYRVLVRLGEDERAEAVFATYQEVKRRIRPGADDRRG